MSKGTEDAVCSVPMVSRAGNAALSRWVFLRHLRQHRRENALICLVLVLGLVFYTVYGTWSHQVSAPAGVQVARFNLLADAVIYVPNWAERGLAPEISLPEVLSDRRLAKAFFGHPLQRIIPSVLRPQYVRPIEELIYVSEALVMSKGGTVKAWGVPGPSDLSGLQNSLVVSSGRWLEGGTELMVSDWLLTVYSAQLGDLLSFRYIRGAELKERQTEGVIVGVYSATHDMMPQVIMSETHLQQLTGFTEPNTVLVWERPLPRHEAILPVPGQQVSEFSLPQFRDMLGEGLAPTRMPTLGELRPGTYHRLTQDVQDVLPYGLMIDDTIRYRGAGDPALGQLYSNSVIKLAPITGLIFLSLTISLTVMMSIIVIDNRRTLGVYRVLGVSPSQLRVLYVGQVTVLGLGATVAGVAIFFLLRPLLRQVLGYDLVFDPGVIGIWFVALAFMAWWSSHVAVALFQSTDIDGLLKGRLDFDWWSIIRI